MSFSNFGQKFTHKSGILQLMDDLGQAMSGNSDLLMLGGGNPGHIPQIQTVFRKRMEQILADKNAFEKLIGNYDPPQGDLASLQQRWPIYFVKLSVGISDQKILP